jgi:hypothetical protein
VTAKGWFILAALSVHLIAAGRRHAERSRSMT